MFDKNEGNPYFISGSGGVMKDTYSGEEVGQILTRVLKIVGDSTDLVNKLYVRPSSSVTRSQVVEKISEIYEITLEVGLEK